MEWNNITKQNQMILKLAHNKEIHMLNKQVSFTELTAFVRNSFRKVPQHFCLSYTDVEGDTIAITAQDDLEVVYAMKVPSLKINIQEATESAKEEDSVEIITEPASISSPAAQVKVEVAAEEPKKEEPVIAEVPKENAAQVPAAQEEQSKPAENTETDPLVALIELVSSKLQEALPELTKRISDTVRSELGEKKQSANVPEEKKAEEGGVSVHVGITCDGCKQYPLTGIRYKCSVCRDFDFCEKCEATKEHPHDFLKIKKPRLFAFNGIPFFCQRRASRNENPNPVNPGFGIFKQMFAPFLNGVPEAPQDCKEGMKRKCHRKEERKEKRHHKRAESSSSSSSSEEKSPVKRERKHKEDRKYTPEEEDRNLALACELEEILHLKLEKCLKFISKHPKLSKEELVAHYFGKRVHYGKRHNEGKEPNQQ